MEVILNPAIILFLTGIAIGQIFKDTLPQFLSKYLGYYLLVSLGLKGGISLRENGFTSEVTNVLSLGVFFALLIPLIAYIYLKNIQIDFLCLITFLLNCDCFTFVRVSENIPV